MKIEYPTDKNDNILEGLLFITPNIYSDSRGLFFESWNKRQYDEYLPDNVEFVQDNQSQSSKGVLRGLHYQTEPFAQGKLVRCAKGSIFDVAVDIRKNSNTFSSWVGIELNEINKKQFWIPSGFAHGFITLSESAEVLYKASGFWNKNFEKTIRWNDQDIGIDWPLGEIGINLPLLSDKDSNADSLSDLIIKNEVFL